MTPDLLWQRYARIWSSEPTVRTTELAACLADRCSYCDVNGLIEGREALSDYMGGFQQSVKGGRFEIRSVIHHHDRMLAEWKLVSADGSILQTGRSFATVAGNGRLQNITGFFDSGSKAS
ncbi:nuclear transport factor 2 family protein [Bradyrhizobium erythrophlei]|uniref:nuclear transport factor 2 family protein n=1 Tax=Bradyrhizobium erythrophlei TaxID=1437360 RepID=UPI0035E57C48